MSVLPDHVIKKEIEQGRLVVDPYDPTLVQPASLDIRLGRAFRTFHNARHPFIDVRDIPADLTILEEVEVGLPFTLYPLQFVLGRSVEHVALPPDLVGRLEGKSSLGRLGLLIHSTAGFFDPGFRGTATLELSNVSNLPIQLYPSMTIGQFSFMRMESPPERLYGEKELGSKYQGQVDPEASRFHENFSK